MSHPYQHAQSSARRFGGIPEDYLPLHNWFDASKEHLANFRHRALRHHTQGIFEAERVFGPTITNSAGRAVPTRLLGEQHVREDCGRIPTLADWLGSIKGESWMVANVKIENPEPPANAQETFSVPPPAPEVPHIPERPATAPRPPLRAPRTVAETLQRMGQVNEQPSLLVRTLLAAGTAALAWVTYTAFMRGWF